MQMAAIKDVARLAGYSPAAVSKYLKNPNSVRPETRERIESAIKELNYTPSAAARSLRTGRTNLYLLMVSHLKNPYFVDQFIALNEEAERRGFHLLVQTSYLDYAQEWNEKASFYVPAIQQVDGIICMLAKSPDVLPRMQEMANHVPVVAYSWPYPCQGLDTVIVDLEGAISQTTNHLLRQGHTRIGYISDHRQSYAGTRDKIDGYYNALRLADIPPRRELIAYAAPGSMGGYAAAEKLLSLEEPPTAIVCENDVLAVACLHYAQEHGISVPEELAITGGDDCDLAQSTFPQLTSTAAPDQIMAATAFDMLAQRQREMEAPPHYVVYHTELVTRGSTQYDRGEQNKT